MKKREPTTIVDTPTISSIGLTVSTVRRHEKVLTYETLRNCLPISGPILMLTAHLLGGWEWRSGSSRSPQPQPQAKLRDAHNTTSHANTGRMVGSQVCGGPLRNKKKRKEAEKAKTTCWLLRDPVGHPLREILPTLLDGIHVCPETYRHGLGKTRPLRWCRCRGTPL